MQLTAGESLALIALAEQVAGREQIALTGPAARAVEKIRAQLPQQVHSEIGDVDRHVSIHLPPSGPAGEAILDVYDVLQQAIRTRRAVRCQYDSLNRETDSAEVFTLRPYALTFDQRAWYVLGHHDGRDAVRRF